MSDFVRTFKGFKRAGESILVRMAGPWARENWTKLIGKSDAAASASRARELINYASCPIWCPESFVTRPPGGQIPTHCPHAPDK